MKKFFMVALAALSMSSMQAAIIDGFDEGSTVLTITTPGDNSDLKGGLLNVLGGARQLNLFYLEPLTGGVASEVRVDDPDSTNSLTISNGSSVDSTLVISWFPFLTGPFDATNGGGDFAFVVGLLAVDLDVSLKFTVTDFGGGVSELTKSNVGVGNVQFKFSDFTGTADLTQLGLIQLQVDGPKAYDAEIDFVGTSAVPEPSTYALIGGALLGLGFLRRRK